VLRQSRNYHFFSCIRRTLAVTAIWEPCCTWTANTERRYPATKTRWEYRQTTGPHWTISTSWEMCCVAGPELRDDNHNIDSRDNSTLIIIIILCNTMITYWRRWWWVCSFVLRRNFLYFFSYININIYFKNV